MRRLQPVRGPLAQAAPWFGRLQAVAALSILACVWRMPDSGLQEEHCNDVLRYRARQNCAHACQCTHTEEDTQM